MRHAKTATFSTAKIKAMCEEQGVDFAQFAEICEKLEGMTGVYSAWEDMIFDRSDYIFKDEKRGINESVPALLVVENW